MKTKEQAITELNETELFCLLHEAIERLKAKNSFYLIEENKKAKHIKYNLRVTLLDSDLHEVVKQMKQNVKESNWLEDGKLIRGTD